MRGTCRVILIHAAVAGLILAGSAAGSRADGLPELSCDLAASKAERDWNLPTGILSAVGTVESGRRGRDGIAPWPWTINAAGRGSHHESKDEAVAAVLGIMATGYPYIDVGCFQIDLLHHAGVFNSLDDAFDPERNAQAAARILLTNRMRSPDWNTAVARYHSATPERGGPYLEKVQRHLPAATSRATMAQIRSAAMPLTMTTLPQPLVTSRLPIVIYGMPPTRAPGGNSPIRRNRTQP